MHKTGPVATNEHKAFERNGGTIIYKAQCVGMQSAVQRRREILRDPLAASNSNKFQIERAPEFRFSICCQ